MSNAATTSPEPTVEEQIALMYLGTVDEGKASAIANRVIAALAPPEGEERPRNADVLYSLILMLSTSMKRMNGTVAFRAAILRGFGDVAAGQLELMDQREKEAEAAGVAPEDSAQDDERAPPKPYSKLASAEDDVYTLDEFRNACSDGAFSDDDGHGRQACKLGADLVYYSADKRHQVKPSDFSGPDGRPMLPGTSHIVWFGK
jgi:hypothetical protein